VIHEERIQAIRAKAGFGDRLHPDYQKVVTEYRAAVAAADTTEERQRLIDSDVADVRAICNLQVPTAIKAAGAEAVQNFETEYSGHDQDFLLHARAEGGDKPLVNELREYGVRLGMEIAGRGTGGMTAAEVDAFRDTFKGKLSATQLNGGRGRRPDGVGDPRTGRARCWCASRRSARLPPAIPTERGDASLPREPTIQSVAVRG
jgi:hypothetical protein